MRRPAPSKRDNTIPGPTPAEGEGRDRGGVGDADGIDPGDLRVVLEERDRPRVEVGREPVEDAGVRVVGADAEAVTGELDQDLLLRRVGLGRPAPLGLPGRDPRSGYVLGDRRGLQDDDHPAGGVDGRARLVDEPDPGDRRGLRGGRRGGGRVTNGEPCGDADRHEGEDANLRASKQTHRAQGTRPPGRAP